ncbi:MAG: right-handed parallel beta-helix repeat-containing protein, partial [Mariniphaga sp.]|nr:right-handed parallel beta-helix repeat-containing protein [Mariniphaga sp.]
MKTKLNLGIMKMTTISMCLFFIIQAGVLLAQTNVQGDVSGTWTVGNSPYSVIGDVNVPIGLTLTIEPGVVVKFMDNYSFTIYGTLLANGTVADSIRFTSGQSLGSPGDWQNIHFNNANNNCSLNYCIVEYGNNGVYISDCNPSITNSTICNNLNAGIYCSTANSSPSISGCKFEGNGSFPVAIFANAMTDLFADNTFVVSGEYDAVNILGGVIGSDLTLSTPPAEFCYYISADLIVFAPSNPTLTLQPGTVIKLNLASITIGYWASDHFGKIVANGVTFTSYRNDNIAGNTNGGTNNEQGIPSDWKGLSIGSKADDNSIINNCIVEYGQSPNIGITICDITISNSTIRYSSGVGIILMRPISGQEAHATITGCTFEGNETWPLEINGGSMTDVFADNTFIAKDAYNAVCISSSIKSDLALSVPPTGFCYYFKYGGGISGPASPTLTLQAGTIVKIGAGTVFSVGGGYSSDYGKLVADGVIFTSYRNDNLAGNTNGGDDNEVGAPGDWYCIYFADNADNNSSLTNCTLEFGGGSSYWLASIHCDDSSPTISGCTISESNSNGIYLKSNASPTISNNTISNNVEAGIYCVGSSNPSILNNIYYDNSIGINTSSSPSSLEYNLFFINNTTGTGSGIPTGFGDIVTVNANGDPCDIYYNLFMDPLFVDPANSNYHLLLNSPCIDAGNPDPSYYDPDGTVADIGAFYFDESQITLEADFSATPTSGIAPLTVNFTDLSTGNPTSWEWDFENDGTIDSYVQNPEWVYNEPGTYTVSLTVSDGTDLSDTEIKADYITVIAVGPTAGFTSDVTSGDAPLAVNFTDQSTQGTGIIDEWSWDFGDGNNSTLQNP